MSTDNGKDVILRLADARMATLAQTKNYIGVTHSDDDSLITDLIAVASDQLDGRGGLLGRSYRRSTHQLQLQRFPIGPICLPAHPVSSVLSVVYTSADGSLATLSSDTYTTFLYHDLTWLRSVDGGWPAVEHPDGRPLQVRIDYAVGDGAVPLALRVACMQLVHDMYDNRSSVGTGRASGQGSMALQRIVEQYADPGFNEF